MGDFFLDSYFIDSCCSWISFGVIFCLGLALRPYIGWFSWPSKDNISSGARGAPTIRNGEDSKMVFVVRQDLGMGKGKAAAQCCHAAIHLYQLAKAEQPKILSYWEKHGCAKVVVKAPDEDALKDLMKAARAVGLVCCVIHDAGRTQIAPNSKTVVGIGPGPTSLIDEVTGHLKLF